MSSTYAGANAYPTDITIPDDGDAADVNSVNPAFEGLADRTTYLAARGIREVFYDSSGSAPYTSLTSNSTNTYADVTDASIGSSGIITLATTTVVGDIVIVDATWH